ncbi:MAG: hypothetical protein Q8L48_08505 [Archangium sp.]|nr:hypothetical protein [Archangium sp.]
MPIRPAARTTGPAPVSTPKPAAPAKPATSTPAAEFTPTRGTALQSKLSELRSMMAGHTDRKEEARILTIFHEASPGELNQLVAGLTADEFHELTEDMDNRIIGPDSRTAFLNLFSKERVGELTVESKTKFIQALQRGSTGRLEEKAIGQVILATKGEPLTALKNALDQGGDYRDLQQLVFHDLDSKELRASVLEHFKKEAPPKGDRVKVHSDIDDTFYVNLKDKRYPGKTVYPGVRALYAELDKGPGAKPDRQGDLLFLSARPYDRAGLIEHGTRSMLADHGVTQATVLSGDLAHVVGNSLIADKKFSNWQQVNQLYPEYGSVFIGDSGQGDAIFGEKAAGANADMRGVFIHNVTGVDAAGKADFARKGVFVFDTYVGAATEAFKKGLITADGLERVMTSASRELAEVPFDKPGQRAERQAELDRDLAAARTALGR